MVGLFGFVCSLYDAAVDMTIQNFFASKIFIDCELYFFRRIFEESIKRVFNQFFILL